MGRLKKFFILLDQDSSVYYTGDEVRGACVLDVQGEFKLSEVKVNMRGVAKVHWTEPRRSGNRLGTYADHYDAEIEYFSMYKVLLEPVPRGSSTVLTTGVHKFCFSFRLPSGISASFESKFASIRYWLKSEVTKSWALNHKTKKGFSVMNRIDTNRQEFQTQVASSLEQRIFCWCLNSGSIALHVRTNKSGYCPGESISITAHIENNSSRPLTPSVTLYQSQTFTARGKCMYRKIKLTSITGLVVEGRRCVNWDGIPLKIPAVSPSINNCCLIRIEYYVRVTLQVRGGKDLSTDLPVTIGTIPLLSCDNDSSTSGRRVTIPPAEPPSYAESLVTHTSTPSCPFLQSPSAGSAESVPGDPPAYSEQDPNPS